MSGFALLLLGAAAAHAVVRWLRVPSTPVLILAGILLARLDLLPEALLQESLVLGVTFLLFATGTELGPGRVRPQRRASIVVGVLQFVVLGGLGFLTALATGFDRLTAAYLGLALTASSTFAVIRLLQRRRQLFEPSGRLVAGVLLLQDVMVILLMPTLIRTPEGVGAAALGVGSTVLLMALAYLTFRWVTPLIVRLHGEEEILLVAALAVLFLFIGLSDALGVPLAAGAFLAGVSLSAFPMSGVLRGQLSSVSDFFSAIFFLSLGALLTAPSLRVLVAALALSALVIIATPLLVTAIAERTGFSARPAIESGLLLAQTSEISLVVGLLGLLLGQISQDAFTVLALVTVVTIVLTPFVASEPVVRRLLAVHPVYGSKQAIGRHDGHIILLGCGSGGMPLLETLLATGEDVVVIDDDPEVIEELRRGDVDCIRADASDPEALRAAGVRRARLISSTVRRPRDNSMLLEEAAGVPVLVRVFEDEDAEWVRERGGTPILYSAEAADEFVSWFRERSVVADHSPHRSEEAR